MANTASPTFKTKTLWALILQIILLAVSFSLVKAIPRPEDAQLRQEFRQLASRVRDVFNSALMALKTEDLFSGGPPGPPGPKGEQGPVGPPGSEANVAALTARVESLERIIQSGNYGTSAGGGCEWIPLTAALASGKYTWVDGGLDRPGITVYPCRVYQSGRFLSGKAATYGSTVYCYVADYGDEHTYDKGFDVLVKRAGVSPSWMHASSSSLPAVAVAADRSSSNPLYVAKCSHSGADVLGYVSSRNTNVMKYGYGETSNNCYSFRILTCRS